MSIKHLLTLLAILTALISPVAVQAGTDRDGFHDEIYRQLTDSCNAFLGDLIISRSNIYEYLRTVTNDWNGTISKEKDTVKETYTVSVSEGNRKTQLVIYIKNDGGVYLIMNHEVASCEYEQYLLKLNRVLKQNFGEVKVEKETHNESEFSAKCLCANSLSTHLTIIEYHDSQKVRYLWFQLTSPKK